MSHHEAGRRFGIDRRTLYARSMTVREIRGHLEELYGVAVSPDLISRVTDAMLEEVREWQTRPLDTVCPVVFLDALRVKIRDEGLVKNETVYLAPPDSALFRMLVGRLATAGP